jgi:uncharacterized protein with GYD domain
LIFISLGKMRKKPTKEMTADAAKMVEGFKKRGIKIIGWYWTLGRYDTVIIGEVANEKEALRLGIDASEFVASETLIAIPREEAIKLV